MATIRPRPTTTSDAATAITAVTVAGLKLGAPPLSAASALVAAFGRLQLGAFEVQLLDRTVDSVVRVLDEASSRELRAWLKLLHEDQGGIIQLMPEVSELFNAAVLDNPEVRYGCVATAAPAPAAAGRDAAAGCRAEGAA